MVLTDMSEELENEIKVRGAVALLCGEQGLLLLFSPSLANIVLQPRPFELSPMYLYVSHVAVALMLGWTVLLFWAQRKPVERASILLITLFPVVTILAATAGAVAKSGWIPVVNLVPLFILYGVICITYIPSCLWAKKQYAIHAGQQHGGVRPSLKGR